MRPFSVVEADQSSSERMKKQLRFVRLFVCGVKPKQQVVGKRIDHLTDRL